MIFSFQKMQHLFQKINSFLKYFNCWFGLGSWETLWTSSSSSWSSRLHWVVTATTLEILKISLSCLHRCMGTDYWLDIAHQTHIFQCQRQKCHSSPLERKIDCTDENGITFVILANLIHIYIQHQTPLPALHYPSSTSRINTMAARNYFSRDYDVTIGGVTTKASTTRNWQLRNGGMGATT